MNYDEVMNIDKVKFGDMPPQPFLLGLLSAFDNRYQAAADAFSAAQKAKRDAAKEATV